MAFERGIMLTTTSLRVGCNYHSLEQLDLRLPFWCYASSLKDEDYFFLLDSARDPGKLGKYSFIGGNPSLVFRAKRQRTTASGLGAAIEVVEYQSRADNAPRSKAAVSRWIGDPFEALRRLLAERRVEYAEYQAHPVRFLSGAVGYIGYEAGYFIEALPDLGVDDLGLPDMYFMFTDSVLAHCNQTGHSYLSVVGRGDNESSARQAAITIRDQWMRRIATLEASADPELLQVPQKNGGPKKIQIRAHFDEASYARAVRTIKEHIFAGDAYEVCFTHRLETPLTGDPWSLYRELRRINPAPFAAYLSLPDAYIISSSPERFLRLDSDGIAESRPIKGTRPRGQTPAQDSGLCRELSTSIKDRAENMMIVDLVRNDFGKVSLFGTVHVPELMTIEPYATVFQMVSTIRGELNRESDGIDLIKACFPGGSMTGAPKIEAMKIIDRLEPVKRGVYSGSIGYIDFSGCMDLNIVIRTIVVKDGCCYLNAGGAIVADSDPIGEYAEAMDKARALIAAIKSLNR